MNDRLYAPLHLLATTLAGIVTGFYLSHALVLGALFSWLADPARLTLLHQTYSEFRVVHPPYLYLAVIGCQLAAVIAFAAVSVLLGRHAALALCAAVCSVAVPILHIGSGFFRLEVGIVSGSLGDAADLSRFVTWNVPIHIFHTVATLGALILLCRVPSSRLPIAANQPI